MGNVGIVIKRHNCREKPGVLEHVRDHTDLAAHGTAKDGMKKGSIGFDRAAEDIGNVIALEHLNVLVPDQRLATVFYIAGLGLTRDPYLMTTVTNMWANIGRSQFHLPTGKAQKLRGCTGLVMPDLKHLAARLKQVQPLLAGTKFSYKATRAKVEITCPWGNRIRCHAPHPRFGNVRLGMAYIELDVRPDTASAIARFYRQTIGAPATVRRIGGARAAEISVGRNQSLIYRESAAKLAKYDGHHIQIYLADFSGPHARLRERGLVTEESDQYQYRFEDIVDVDSGATLFKLEHEVRSMTHPLYARPLVNRNPNQSNTKFAQGHETAPWALPYEA